MLHKQHAIEEQFMDTFDLLKNNLIKKNGACKLCRKFQVSCCIFFNNFMKFKHKINRLPHDLIINMILIKPLKNKSLFNDKKPFLATK